MGILASSESVTMTTSTSDDVSSGYITREQITLTLTSSGSSYQWGQSIPSQAGSSLAALDAPTAATCRFTPPAPGIYVLTCRVDTTNYVLRISVLDTAVVGVDQVRRLSPVADNQVPTPSLGASIYFSSDQDALVLKDATGALFTFDLTAVTP